MPTNNLPITICAADEASAFRKEGITHLVSISNPGGSPRIPIWFSGDSLNLQFGDVVSNADAVRCRTTAPTRTDVTRAIEFARKASALPQAHLLVFCDYGASRSPAMAYVMLAALQGAGRESESFARIMEIRPEAVMNALIVRLGDELLQRSGALLEPMRRYDRQIWEGLGLGPDTQ